MKKPPFGLLALALSFPFVVMPVIAHHGSAAYDTDVTKTGKVAITEFEWTQPHSQIHFDLTDEKGDVQHWAVEMPPPSMVVEHGWTRKSLNPGDVVTITFHPARNGVPRGIMVKVVLPNGKELTR